MFFKRPILLICFCVLVSLSNAQQVNFIKYTVQDGLVANPIRCIYQDNKGFIWIGTYEGLSRYDGYKFANYTNTNGLSHNVINSFIEANDKLLVAENNGAIDVIQNNSIQKGVMASSAVNIVRPYKNRLLLTTDASGFYEYKNNSLFSPVQEKTGTALGHFLPINDSLLLCDGVEDNLFIYKKDLTVVSSLKNLGIHFFSLFQDSKKRIWACTTGGLKLLEILYGKEPAVAFIPLPFEFNFSPLTHAQVTSMIEEDDGSFWIGTMKGLVRIFPSGSSYIYNEKDGLPSAMIYTLYFDKEKNLWVGTSLGLAKWTSKNHVVFYNTDNGDFKNDVLSVHPSDNKKIILKTDHGLQYFYVDTKDFKNIKASAGYHTPVAGVAPPIVHYENKIGTIDSIKNIIIPFEKFDTAIDGVLFSSRHPDGTIFLGSFSGLFAIKKSTVKILPHRITGLVIDNNGNIWVGTWNEGIFCIKIRDTIGTRYDVKDLTAVIRQRQIRSLFIDSKKNVWVGTRYAGSFCLTEKATGVFDIQHFNRQSGLMS